MKKLLETSLGNNDGTWFSLGGRRVTDKEAIELIKRACNPYETKDNGGVLVYMSEQEFDEYQERRDKI